MILSRIPYRRPRGGTVFPCRDDGEHLILRRDCDPDPFVGAVGVTLQLVEDLWLHELRMRVERRKHALERAVDELLVGGLVGIDVSLPDRFKNLGEKFHLLEAGVFLRLLLGKSSGSRRKTADRRREASQFKGGTFHPRTFS